MTTAAKDLAAISIASASEWIAMLADQEPEVASLAADLVAQGAAHVELHTEFLRARAAHRLLLVPDGDAGDPVELFAVGCEPTAPTPAGVESRFWFFGKLSHWQPKH